MLAIITQFYNPLETNHNIQMSFVIQGRHVSLWRYINEVHLHVHIKPLVLRKSAVAFVVDNVISYIINLTLT